MLAHHRKPKIGSYSFMKFCSIMCFLFIVIGNPLCRQLEPKAMFISRIGVFVYNLGEIR
jgi:ATP/ADP translocase